MMFDSDEEYMDSLKREDHYHFSIPFTYIKKRLGNDEYEDGTATMEVDIDWDESQHGYVASYHCPSIDQIDPNEGNGDEECIWENEIYFEVSDRLSDMGIPAEACAFC